MGILKYFRFWETKKTYSIHYWLIINKYHIAHVCCFSIYMRSSVTILANKRLKNNNCTKYFQNCMYWKSYKTCNRLSLTFINMWLEHKRIFLSVYRKWCKAYKWDSPQAGKKVIQLFSSEQFCLLLWKWEKILYEKNSLYVLLFPTLRTERKDIFYYVTLEFEREKEGGNEISPK